MNKLLGEYLFMVDTEFKKLCLAHRNLFMGDAV